MTRGDVPWPPLSLPCESRMRSILRSILSTTCLAAGLVQLDPCSARLLSYICLGALSSSKIQTKRYVSGSSCPTSAPRTGLVQPPFGCTDLPALHEETPNLGSIDSSASGWERCGRRARPDGRTRLRVGGGRSRPRHVDCNGSAHLHRHQERPRRSEGWAEIRAEAEGDGYDDEWIRQGGDGLGRVASGARRAQAPQGRHGYVSGNETPSHLTVS